MADKQAASHLKTELAKEEILLRNIKGKLMDQLQRLKVEELALTQYLSLSSAPNNQITSTGSYFSTQMNPTNIGTNKNDEQINSVPLSGLTEKPSSNTFMTNTSNDVEEEEEDEEY